MTKRKEKQMQNERSRKKRKEKQMQNERSRKKRKEKQRRKKGRSWRKKLD